MKKDIEKSLRLLKYLTVVCFILMTLNCVLLFFGLRQPYAEVITICIGFYLIYTEAVKIFRLCFMMRVMLMYVFASMLCIWTQRYRGLGEMREYARMAMLVIGLLIALVLILRTIIKYRKRVGSYRNKSSL